MVGPSPRSGRLPAALRSRGCDRPGRLVADPVAEVVLRRPPVLLEVQGQHLRGQRDLGDGAGARGVAEFDNDAVARGEPGHHMQTHGPYVADARLGFEQRGVVDRAALRRHAHPLVDDLHDRPVPQPPDGDPDLLVRGRVPRRVVEQFRQDVRDVVDGAGGDADPGLDHAERDPVEALDLLRGGHDDGGAPHIGRADPGVAVTAQHQQVVGVALHAHREVVESEEGLHPCGVGLVPLHRVQLGHHDRGQPGAPARDTDQRLGQLLVCVGLLCGEPNGFVVDGVERLTHLADLVLARGPHRIAGAPGHLLRRRTAQRAGLGQLGHHGGQPGVGDLMRGVAQIAQPPDHDAPQTDRDHDDADQGQHHQGDLRTGRPDEGRTDVGDLGEDSSVDPLLHRTQQFLTVVGRLLPLLRGDREVLAGARAPDLVLQASGLQGPRPGEGPFQPGPPGARAEVEHDADRFGVAHPAGVEGPLRGGGEPARGLCPRDGDLLLGGVLGGLGQGGRGADPVRDVGVDAVGLRDAVAVAVEVGDHDPIAEGEGGDGAALRADLGAEPGHLLHEAFDAVQGAPGAARYGGESLGPAAESGDAPVSLLGA
ncbi:hypothetical protein P376_0161 [Streptomyces sp. HCCB10043]|nr:hypothetical protein P376_0161 [Streptomyces sp. HCCB10043]